MPSSPLLDKLLVVSCLIIIIVVVMLLGWRYAVRRGPSSAASLYRGGGLSTSSTAAASAAAAMKWAVSHPSYDILESTVIKEYDLKATMYKHKRSGAEVISVITDDNNKVFGINFATPPSDSMGIPHILEHSVLCGSRKYPVKEPFADLLKGSLQNFLNAFTYPDRTCYPVASTNTKDFYNLVNVYLDSVLYPRALKDPMVLQQEGWHYELEKPEDPLTIKGVVYNEMKGVYSQPRSLMYRATQQNLFPNTTYGVDSGGDPDVIPLLDFNTFTDFHSKFYHPSNSKVFFYGNDDPVKRLDLLDDYLKDFVGKTVNQVRDARITSQSKFDAPRSQKIYFPLDANADQKHMISVNWVLSEKQIDLKTSLALIVLDHLLTGTSSSSLRKTLIESNLGESLLGGGVSDDLFQGTYSVGMKGVMPENVTVVENLILKSLQNLSVSGFDDDAIEAAINTLEFRLREFSNGGGSPKGLDLMLGMLPHWIYGRNPFDAVRFEESLSSLKKDIKEKKPIFQEMIKNLIVDNMHRLTVEAIPDTELEKKNELLEVERLAKIKESFTPEVISDIINKTALLKEAQLREDSPEARETIPRLSLSDIDSKHTDPISTKFETFQPDNVPVLINPIQTNGILYADVVFDYSKLSFEELPYVPLFLSLLTESGTSTYDQVALSRKIGASTGGIHTGSHQDIKFNQAVSNGDDFILKIVMSGKAVGDKTGIMVDLMQDMLLNTNFDNQRRSVELLRSNKAAQESKLTSAGQSLAGTRIAAKYSFLGYFSETMGGLTGIRRSGDMLKRAENNWPEVLEVLKSIHGKVVSKDGVIINLTGDENTINNSLGFFKKLTSSLPSGVCGGNNSNGNSNNNLTLQERWKTEKHKHLLPLGVNEAFSIPSQVNYVVKGGQLVDIGETVSASYGVLAKYLSNGYLWDNIRVVGGAYGGSCGFSSVSGRMSFSSYRDPNLVKTIEAYDLAPSAFEDEHLNQERIDEVIIGTIGSLDSPMSADQKGFSALSQYLSGESVEDRQLYRNQVLSTSVHDIPKFASKLKELLESKSSVVVFGSQSALIQANEEMKSKSSSSEEQDKPFFVIENAYVKDKDDKDESIPLVSASDQIEN